MLQFDDYSYRHGKEILFLQHKQELNEINHVLKNLQKFPHGRDKNVTPAEYIASAFEKQGWKKEHEIELSPQKRDSVDLFKNRVAIEQEYSKYETLFRDFFRLILLYDERLIDVGVIITYSKKAFKNWEREYRSTRKVKPYSASRASLDRIKDFLEGKYNTVIRIPLYCIGIE